MGAGRGVRVVPGARSGAPSAAVLRRVVARVSAARCGFGFAFFWGFVSWLLVLFRSWPLAVRAFAPFGFGGASARPCFSAAGVSVAWSCVSPAVRPVARRRCCSALRVPPAGLRFLPCWPLRRLAGSWPASARSRSSGLGLAFRSRAARWPVSCPCALARSFVRCWRLASLSCLGVSRVCFWFRPCCWCPPFRACPGPPLRSARVGRPGFPRCVLSFARAALPFRPCPLARRRWCLRRFGALPAWLAGFGPARFRRLSRVRRCGFARAGCRCSRLPSARRFCGLRPRFAPSAGLSGRGVLWRLAFGGLFRRFGRRLRRPARSAPGFGRPLASCSRCPGFLPLLALPAALPCAGVGFGSRSAARPSCAGFLPGRAARFAASSTAVRCSSPRLVWSSSVGLRSILHLPPSAWLSSLFWPCLLGGWRERRRGCRRCWFPRPFCCGPRLGCAGVPVCCRLWPVFGGWVCSGCGCRRFGLWPACVRRPVLRGLRPRPPLRGGLARLRRAGCRRLRRLRRGGVLAGRWPPVAAASRAAGVAHGRRRCRRFGGLRGVFRFASFARLRPGRSACRRAWFSGVWVSRGVFRRVAAVAWGGFLGAVLWFRRVGFCVGLGAVAAGYFLVFNHKFL